MRRARQVTNLWDLHPRLLRVLWELDGPWRELTGEELTLYSGRDSKHGRGSLHYLGCAVDIRTWSDPRNARSGQMSGKRRAAALSLVRNLAGDAFDALDERTHFHLEFHPKIPSHMRPSP